MGIYGKSKYGKTRYGSASVFIFDRTETDLINGTAKAYINYNDLNRIENGMKNIADKFDITIPVKIDWTEQLSTTEMYNFPVITQMDRIISNLNILIQAGKEIYNYEPTVDIPITLNYATIYIFNNFEKILDELYIL